MPNLHAAAAGIINIPGIIGHLLTIALIAINMGHLLKIQKAFRSGNTHVPYEKEVAGQTTAEIAGKRSIVGAEYI